MGSTVNQESLIQSLKAPLGKAWIHGDPRKVVYPTDSTGQFCGQKGTSNENKTILMYFNILRCASPVVLISLQCPTTQLCVSKCPDRFATYLDMQANRYNRSYWEYYKQFCKPGFDNPWKSIAEVLRDEDCPSMIIPSRPFLKRCFPDFSTRKGVLTVANKTMFKDASGQMRNVTDLREAANGINNVLDARSFGMKIFEDYASSWYWILIALFIAMVVSLLFLILLRFTAGVLFWIFIVGVIGVVGYGIWHCFWEYGSLKGAPGADLTIYDIGLQTDFRVYLQLRQTWLAFSVLAFFFFTRKIPVITDEAPALNYYWVPLLTVIIGSYLIAHGFFSVYAMCVDTLFLCFCEDLERNDGSASKPYFMSPNLHRILGKKEVNPKKAKVEDLERNDGSTEKPFYMNKSLMKILKKQNVQTATQ
ncbi:hypothetical protein FKM82_001856 [Ascaphus truei]